MKKYSTLYKELPNCYLLNRLYEKCIERYDLDFDYLGAVNNIRKRVSAEVTQINQLFPEYTPHDKEYHLKRLFNVADEILGKQLIDNMNSTELLILSCSLYCHDWGMAVSDSEKEMISSTEKIENNSLWILDNERELFEEFLQQHGIKRSKHKEDGQVPIEIWRNYVRQTHALRSGKRVFNFFENDDIGLASAIEKVCVGHWLEFKDLRKYPTSFTVQNETVNIRALAIYVRLIDLLDITSYRTPYVLWKYVSPRNPYSKMEWDKHRAIQSLSIKKYQEGRAIQINGVTHDHEVYASLEDMKEWCYDQFRGCNDLLAEINDSKHKLDIYNIDWQIETRGFVPTKIRFEFDREKMFELLAAEIYEHDSYVFLRELLQNSIDAIRMRRSLLFKATGDESSNIGLIKVEVKHLDEGNAVINWIDDGIGMNEHIIKNYLAVAGKSYYSSDEYKNQNLNMDAISRFGIGILSCFAVAEQIEFETCRERYSDPSNKLFRVNIPSVTNHFRIESHINTNNFTGTKVTIYVEGQKLFKNDKNNLQKKLDVTKYLKIIAGFVDVPIIIQEDELKTIIVHPKSDENKIMKNFGKEYKIHKIDLSYPWNRAFIPQDISISKDVFIEQQYDINDLLPSKGYEGSITYLSLENSDEELIKGSKSYDYNYKSIIVENRIKKEKCEVRVRNLEYSIFDKICMSKSCEESSFFAVYRDGILISKALAPKQFYNNYEYLGDVIKIPLRIVVNIPSLSTERVDLARVHLLGQEESWDKPIKFNYIKKLLEKNKEKLKDYNMFKKAHELGRLSAYKNISYSEMWENMEHGDWPIFILEGNGEVKCYGFKDLKDDVIYNIPNIIEEKIYEIIYGKIYFEDRCKCIIDNWIGERCFINLDGSIFGREYFSFCSIKSICQMPIIQYFQMKSVRFINSPFDEQLPLLQEVWSRKVNIDYIVDKEFVLKKAFDNPLRLTDDERAFILNRVSYKYDYNIPQIIEFNEPFNEYFAYGLSTINFLHPIGQVLVRAIAFLELEKLNPNISLEQLGCLIDCFKESKISSYDKCSYDDYIISMKQIWSKIYDLRLFEIGRIEKLVPYFEEFIPGTIIKNKERRFILASDDIKKRIKEKSMEFQKNNLDIFLE